VEPHARWTSKRPARTTSRTQGQTAASLEFEEGAMTISRIIETGARPEQYDEVSGRLETAPVGRLIHVAAKKDDGTIRVVEVWESRDQAEAFGEKVTERLRTGARRSKCP
jgi:hypothetical protein